MNKSIGRLGAAIRRGAANMIMVAAALFMGSAHAADLDFGKPGEPVHLVVGYQPYYSQSWSGVVMRDQAFWKKHLPPGSTVEFQIGLQGAIIVNAMLAGKQHIGYMGDMPAIVSTTKSRVADIRLVASLGLGHDQCNIFLTRTDAPEFKDAREAIRWLDGKQVAVPKGSCTDRFAQAVFQKEGIQPKSYLNQNIEVITSGFRAKKLDAAVIWEPTASKLVEEGLARRVASGATVSENDGGFLAMRADLIQQRPDIVKAWLRAELEAQRFIADPNNAQAVARMAAAQTTGFTERTLWMSLFGAYPEIAGGHPVRNSLQFTFTPPVMELVARATAFLQSVKSIDVDKLRPEAIMPEFSQQVLEEAGLQAPIGEIKALPASEFKGT